MNHARGTRNDHLREYGIFREVANGMSDFGAVAVTLSGGRITPIGLGTYAQMSTPANNDNNESSHS